MTLVFTVAIFCVIVVVICLRCFYLWCASVEDSQQRGNDSLGR